LRAGRSPYEPVAFIEKGTTEQQRTVISTLGEVAQNPPPVSPPAVIVIGKVVELAEKLSRFNETHAQSGEVLDGKFNGTLKGPSTGHTFM